MLHVKGWGWLEGDTKFKPESPAKFKPESPVKFKPEHSMAHYSYGIEKPLKENEVAIENDLYGTPINFHIPPMTFQKSPLESMSP